MSAEQPLIFTSKPELRNPFVVCGLDGWVNSGNVAAGGVKYLIKQFNAEKFAELPLSRYHIYQVPGLQGLGPNFRMENGLITETHLPRNEFFYARNPASDHDLIFFLGTEPNLNWEEYADIVVGLAGDFGAFRLYALGGLLAKIPYAREPNMTCTCTSAKIRDEIEQYNVMFSNRKGPATFNQMLMYACQKKGLDGAVFNVRAPYYPEFSIAIAHSPRSIQAALVRLDHLMQLNLNLDEIVEAAADLQSKFDLARQQNTQFNSYIENLEKNYVEMPYREPLDISPSEAIRFAEELLKENKNPESGI